MRKTFDYTFPETGVTVKVRKVSPFIAVEARAALSKDPKNPKPEPPKVLIDEPGPLQGTYEENTTDPDYIAALREWENGIQIKITELLIKRTVVEILDEGWQEDVLQYRLDMESIGKTDLPDDDKYVYIIYLAAAAVGATDLFGKFLTSTVNPTEGVSAAIDSFSSNP